MIKEKESKRERKIKGEGGDRVGRKTCWMSVDNYVKQNNGSCFAETKKQIGESDQLVGGDEEGERV